MEARLVVHITLVRVPLFTEQKGPNEQSKERRGMSKTEEKNEFRGAQKLNEKRNRKKSIRFFIKKR